MQITIKMISATLLFGAAVMLTGCTSSSDSSPAVASAPVYSGNTSPAAITTTNAKSIGVTATEAANEAINADKGNSANPFVGVSIVDNASFSEKLTSITRSLVDTAIATNLPVGTTITADELGTDFCGGSVSIPDSASSSSLNGSFTYNNLCYDDKSNGQVIINGTVVFAQTSTSITMTYVDFTVTTGGTAESFNATITCDTSSTSSTSCTFSSTFVGSDGSVHSIDNYTVTGDDTFGYNVSATFYHDTYGEVTIFTSAALTFGACGVYPDGGEIYIESGTGSNIYITFYPSCTYTIVGTDGTATIGPLTGNW